VSLAAAARFEVNERIRLYPAAVRNDKITRDVAECDVQCWDAIACALERRTSLDTQIFTRAQIDGDRRQAALTALDRAVANRKRALAAAPDDAALAARHEAVEVIAIRMRQQIAAAIDLNRALNEHTRASMPLAAAA
jgi:hypothetical protein